MEMSGDDEANPAAAKAAANQASFDDAEMTADQARAALGVAAGASAREIREAHRRMKIAHPDRGGSSYLATQINRAEDVLLDA